MPKNLIATIPGDPETIDLGTHQLAYVSLGKGKPIVFLHGGLMDHQSWGNQLPLADTFHMILPDTRGHGRSGGANLAATYAAFADDVVAFLDTLMLNEVTLVGFSDGGCTALDVAKRHPNRIANLVLIGTPYNLENYNPGVIDRFRSITSSELLESAAPILKEEINKMRVYMSDEEWGSYWDRIMKGLWVNEPNYKLADFANLSVRTLILHGENEQYFEREVSEDLVSTIQGAKLIYVPGTSHAAAQENPDFVNDAIRNFVNLR